MDLTHLENLQVLSVSPSTSPSSGRGL